MLTRGKNYVVRDDRLFVIEHAEEDIMDRIEIISMLETYLVNWNLSDEPTLATKMRTLLEEPHLHQGITKRLILATCDVQTAIAQEISNTETTNTESKAA